MNASDGGIDENLDLWTYFSNLKTSVWALAEVVPGVFLPDTEEFWSAARYHVWTDYVVSKSDFVLPTAARSLKQWISPTDDHIGTKEEPCRDLQSFVLQETDWRRTNSRRGRR